MQSCLALVVSSQLSTQTLSSLISSVVLAASATRLSWRTTVLASVFNLAVSSLTYQYMSSYWKGKAKVPLVQDFNDAIRTSNQMLWALRALAISWGVSCHLYAWQFMEPKTI